MPTNPTQRKSLFAAFTSLADELTTEKNAAAAAVKRADGPVPADPGGMAGKSTHPTATADNGCQTPTEGARSSENESDVKDQQGAPSVNNTSEAKPGDEKDRSINQGMQASLVGDDPATEDNYKTDKDDPGTSHPAKTDDGKKYGSLNFKQSHAEVNRLSNEILAELFLELDPKSGKVKSANAPAAAPAAMAAGYELAGLFGFTTKEAAEANVRDAIAATINDALLEADLIGSFLKSAGMDEASEGEDHASPEGAEEGSGSGAGESEGASSLPGDSASDGGGGGGPPPGGDAGGPPMGGDPMGGGGAPGAGGPANPEELIQELVAAMVEMGVTPEMFAQMSQGAGGGGDPMGGAPMGGPPGMGAPPPGAGAPPPGMGAPPPGGDPMALGAAGAPPGGGGGDMSGLLQDGAKLAAVTRNYMMSGKFEFKEAKTVRSRQLRNFMKGHIRELFA